MIDYDGCKRLARHDHGDERRRSEPWRGHDRTCNVEGAESAADPDPPRRMAEPAQRRQRLEDERGGHAQDDRSGEERHERRPYRALQPGRKLRVDAELDGQRYPGGEGEQDVGPGHCSIRFRGGMLVPLPATGRIDAQLRRNRSA
jgi:hypothetical protein